MSYLVIEQNGAMTGTELGGRDGRTRLLVGRRAGNDVVIDDPSIARLHAWIQVVGGQTVIADTGARGGTIVSGERLRGRRVLRDGDEIRIGAARLRFLEGLAIPQQVRSAEPTHDGATADGILFDCGCGAPLWVPSGHAGRRGRCRYCGAGLIIPQSQTQETGVETPPAQSNARRGDPCGICQCDIAEGEQTTTCPDCGLTFHSDCWTENCGCAAYGCSQVNVSAPASAVIPAREVTTELAEATAPPVPAPTGIPWAFVLLAAAVIAAMAGVLAFGSLSLIVLACVIAYAIQKRSDSLPTPALTAGIISILGLLAGLAVSYFWWLAPG